MKSVEFKDLQIANMPIHSIIELNHLAYYDLLLFFPNDKFEIINIVKHHLDVYSVP